MAYITNYQYLIQALFDENANWGEYQFVTLKDIVNNFMLMYVGDNDLSIT